MVNRLLFPLLSVAALSAAAGAPAALDAHARDVFNQTMKVMDGCFDDRIALIRPLVGLKVAGVDYPPRHMVRESSWYAVGLLMRDQAGDRDRAVRVLNAVLAKQMDEPEQRWHGTFYRAPEEPHPEATTAAFRGYDPNWREFIGTTFEIILIHFEDRLPKTLVARLEGSIKLAVDGEIHEGRLKPAYTNIALLYGALISFAGDRLHRGDWSQRATEWTDAVYSNFKLYGAFPEFNSPTYNGPDLFGLALWRAYGSTPRIRSIGSEMEAALWRTTASLYHAGLKNISGPYDRSYGMDMRRYVSVTGLWLRTALDADIAPLPAIEYNTEHGNDLAYAPCYLLVPSRIPDDAMKSFRKFRGEHQVRQQITDKRTATAWIGKDVMYGGEFTSMTRDVSAVSTQFHPATAHWKMPDGDVGWIRLVSAPRVDAVASRKSLNISCTGDATFRIKAKGADAATVQRERWKLPGLTVEVDTDAAGASASAHDGYVDIAYRNATRFTLRMKRAR